MGYKAIMEDFGFQVQEINQIYAYAPVFKQELNGDSCVLKRTRSPLPMAEELVRWTTTLSQQGISVVTPLESISHNPRQIGSDVWVVYPFYHGYAYKGSLKQIAQAGQQLGQIHALEYSNCQLPSYDWEAIEDDELQQNLKVIQQYTNVDLAPRLDLHDYINLLKYFSEVSLPTVISVWDYKANNLIFDCEKVTLIDPDSAGQLPRIFDLAIALLLFHNDCEEHTQWPCRVFNRDEWQVFFQAYSQYITLTELEKNLWLQAIQLIFIDEALWLLGNDQEGWQNNPKQKSYLLSLVNIDWSAYLL